MILGCASSKPLVPRGLQIALLAAIIALPGGAGTASEVSLADDYKKPVIVYSPDLALVEGFPQSIPLATTLDGVQQFLGKYIKRAA